MKKRIKQLLLRNMSVDTFLKLTLVKNFFGGKAYQNNIDINSLLDILSRTRNVFFVQIGANDGITHDPIREFIVQHRWKGILVEPMPDMFVKLQTNYTSFEGLQFENAGIGERNEKQVFYSLPVDMNDPEWLQQIGSFDKNAFIKNASSVPGAVERMIEQELSLITWKALVDKYRITSIDILVIDAEGFEYKILKQLPSTDIYPYIILFEWGSMDEQQLDATIQLLSGLNYKLHRNGGDMFCIRKA